MLDDAEETCCWMALHAVDGMGPATFRRLISGFGSARAVVENASAALLAHLPHFTTAMQEAIARIPKDLPRWERMADKLRLRGVRIVRMGRPGHPPALMDLQNPPPLLYVLGNIADGDRRSVSMVGTTKPTDKGKSVATQFAARFAANAITVVSGYAHGIDAAAHRGAFEAGGRSILCLPYGIANFKSRPDFPDIAEIGRRGAIISECPPEQEWTSASAIARNRIIAALGSALFVIETPIRGGTMHTVKAAELLQRPVFVLKYQTHPEAARGNSILIARGATPISTFTEIGRVVESL